MTKAKLFQNGRSQAVRLPREFRFPGAEVQIKKVGNAVVLIPLNDSWDSLFASLSKFSADFMTSRRQPALEKRDDPFA